MKKLFFVLVSILLIVASFSSCGSNGKSLINSALEKTLTILSQNNDGGSGNVDPSFGSHPYKAHEHVIVTATPSPGSLFAGWMGIDGVLTEKSAVDPSKPSSGLDNKIEVVMQHDVTLTALFFRAFNLTVNVNGSGVVRVVKVEGLGGLDATMFTGDITQNTPGGHIYAGGEYVTFAIVSGTFTGWTWNGDMNQIASQYLPPAQPYSGQMTIPLNPTSNSVTVYMNHDVNLTANFQ